MSKLVDEIADVVADYGNGYMRDGQYSLMFDKLYQKFGISGLCMGGKEEKLPDGSVRRVSTLQAEDGSDTGIKLVQIILEKDFGTEYTSYIA